MLTVPDEHQLFLLHRAPAPGSNGIAPADTPTLQPYVLPPEKRTNGSVIVCPGGGYVGLAPHEGEPVARWFNSLGISAFVLRYRVKPHTHPTPLNDAKRAIRFVRHHAASWGLDPANIGILGFSAGGHLAAAASVHYDAGNPESPDPINRHSSKPQLQLLIYPVITLKNIVYQASFNNLTGSKPEGALADELSLDLHVNAQTPPAFIFHSTADTAVPVMHADVYVDALKKHNVPASYVRGDFGAHGIGIHEWWTSAAAKFLQEHGF